LSNESGNSVHAQSLAGCGGPPDHPNYDVMRNSKSFIMLKFADDERQLVVVQNWIRELRQRTARKH